jgi:hypothetical protein
MRFRLLLSLFFVAFTSVSAQTTETPVPFDSAARVLSIGPQLASRLGLVAPAWPVTGEFVEARLFRVSSGGHSLSVSRPTGAVDRYSLDDTQMAALRAAVVEGIARAGRVVAEDNSSLISEPARGPFVRDQMVLASLIYGPALASLTNDGTVGTGVYMLSVGGTFFALNEFARKRSITKAQNALATDGAIRGWAASALAASIILDDIDDDGAALLALAGGIGGSAIGYNRGRGLTNSEAHAAMTGSTLAAGAALGATIASGIVNENTEKLGATVILAGGLAGYLAGPAYPRRATYSVTAGDVGLVRLGSLLGTAAAITPFAEVSDLGPKSAAAILTAGWVGGALLADRIAAKPFNHSAGDARMIYVGALGGALIGSAFPIMSQTESAVFAATAVTGGAIAGAIITQRMMNPAREGTFMRSSSSSNANGAKFQLNPEGALMAATGQRGNHTLLTIRF